MKLIKSLLAILVLGILALLPLGTAQALGRWLGRRMWHKGKKSKMARHTKRNIEACFPDMPDAEREALIRQSLEQTGCTLCEMGMAWLWSPKRSLKKIRKVHNEEGLLAAQSKGKGVILIAPHIGNWEIINLYLSNRYPFTAMYKPPRMKLMDDLVKRMRARLGTRMAPADTKGVRMVMKALKRGEMIGILPDQEPEKTGGIHVPFFGIQALTMKLVPQLAAQTGSPVLCAYAERLPNAEGFDLYFTEVDPAINSRELELAATAMNRAVEECVLKFPEQYQWEYKRFNTRPEGEPRFY